MSLDQPKTLNQDKLSLRNINNMKISGDINYQRRKNDGKQITISSENSKNPFRSLIKVKYLFEKYEKKQSTTSKSKNNSGARAIEQSSQL